MSTPSHSPALDRRERSARNPLLTKAFFTSLLSLSLLTACARHYNITLNNNHVVTTYSKPKLNQAGDAYVFKDSAGHTNWIPRGNVKLIEPRSHGAPATDPLFMPPRP